LIFRKIIKIVATICHILKLKCTEFDFGWGSDPHPAGGAFSAPADPLAKYKVATSKGRERMKDGREGQGRDLLLRGGGKGRKVACRNWRGMDAPGWI